MPATLALGPFCAAVLAALQANAALVASVTSTARIVDQLPDRPGYPAVLVESQGETPYNTLGEPATLKYGSQTRATVRVLSQYRSDSEAHTIGSLVRGALDGQRLTLAGVAKPAVVTFDSAPTMFKTVVSGIVTRELVLQFSTTVHQA